LHSPALPDLPARSRLPLLSDAGLRGGASGTEQAIVEVRAGNVAYRVAGDFTRNGKQAAAPLRQVTFESRFTS
jgi:hypothetical protein